MQKQKRRHSIKLMVTLFTAVFLLIFALAVFFMTGSLMTGMLVDAETNYITEQSRHVSGLLEDKRRDTFNTALDIAVWDQTVDFISGEQLPDMSGYDFINNNWPEATILETFRYNFIMFISKDDSPADGINKVYYSEFFDFAAAEKDSSVKPDYSGSSDIISYVRTLSEETLGSLAALDKSEPAAEDFGRSGIVQIGGKAHLLAVMPIMPVLSSDITASGTVTIGCELSDGFFKRLTHYATMSFDIASCTGSVTPMSISRNDNKVETGLILEGMNGENLRLIMSDGRTVYKNGLNTVYWTVAALIIIILIFFAVMYFLLTNYAIKPIVRLSGEVADAGNTPIDTEHYNSSKELYSLSSTINDMVSTLSQSKVSLNVLMTILNSLDAYIYVSDPGTDEILFINEKMIEHFGIDKSSKGQVCWKLLQRDMEKRCGFCPVNKLGSDINEVVVWEETNSVTGRIYKNTDRLIEWEDGRLAHMQYRVDITDIRNAEESLKRRLKQQELMSTISQNFIVQADMDELIENALRMTGEFLDASKIVIAGFDKGRDRMGFKYGWLNPAQKVSPLGKTSLAFEKGMIIYDEFIVKKSRYFCSSDTLADPRYKYLSDFGVKSFITIPLFNAGELWGIISVDDCRTNKEWNESDIHLLLLIANVISGAITKENIEESLVRMSSIASSSPSFITYTNPDGGFEYINPGSVVISGYSEEELLAGGIDLIFDKDTTDMIRRDILPTAHLVKRTVELPMKCSDGQTKIINFSLFPTGLNDGGQGTIGYDVTETRKLENDLVEAKNLAEQSSRAKGDFLSRMSHEMRTPMNAIIGMTNIAMSSKDIEKKDYCLDKIDDASRHLLGVINDILDMSKIESGKFDISCDSFNFEKMLMNATDVINFKIEEKHQNLIVRVDHTIPPFIISDEQRIKQVITNLLSNANKFTPEDGTIKLSIKAGKQNGSKYPLIISVKDSGIGISGEQQAKLFRSFEQADGTISRKYGGTGLGLVISKSIANLLGGDIAVKSELGKGSEFIFTLEVDTDNTIERTKEGLGVSWNNVKVLVVDDSEDVLEYFRLIGESYKFHCETAISGSLAYDMITTKESREDMFNIIFVDWKMPEMNGIEFTKKIREHLGQNTVVIMISAAERGEIEHAAKEAGIRKFLQKPLFSSLIIDCINDCLGIGIADFDQNSEDYTDCFKGRNILLAEDIEINREIVSSILEGTGLCIDYAENGKEALEIFAAKHDKYDMVFMDVHMPEMDGYEATKRIRALDTPKASIIPIVAMTANVFREDIEKCLDAGMNDHIGKPLDINQLMQKLKNYLPNELSKKRKPVRK